MNRKIRIFVAIFATLLLGTTFGVGCKSQKKSKDDEKSGGIAAQVAEGSSEKPDEKEEEISHGGITSVPEDPKLVEKGKKLFSDKGCEACHGANSKKVGPPLGGVTERRDADWIAKMILHPREMLKKDPQAKKLLKEYGTRMADQDVSPKEARALLAYLGTLEEK